MSKNRSDRQTKVNKIRRILIRDGDCCWLCGYVIYKLDLHLPEGNPDFDAVTLDHIVPVSRGGPSTVDNLKLAHRCCNEFRRDYPVTVELALDCSKMFLTRWRESVVYSAERPSARNSRNCKNQRMVGRQTPFSGSACAYSQ